MTKYHKRLAAVKKILIGLGDKVTPDNIFELVNFYLGITKRNGRVTQLEGSPQIAPIVHGVINEVYGSRDHIPDSLKGLYGEAEKITENNRNNGFEITRFAYSIQRTFKKESDNSSGPERLQ